ncbi:MAG: hypothetical protein ACREJ3_10030, partial [Polyangiaceae bacterium]
MPRLTACALNADGKTWARRILRLGAVGLALYLTSTVFLTFNDAFFHNGIGYDESFFVWGGWSINRGLAPYKDFIEFKPPLVFLTHALALKLYGFEGQRYRVFFELFPLAAILMAQASLIQR